MINDLTESPRCCELGRKRIIKWTAEGAVKSFFKPSILRRVGIRQLPGICWYSVESRVRSLKQGGTAELNPSLTSNIVMDGFFF